MNKAKKVIIGLVIFMLIIIFGTLVAFGFAELFYMEIDKQKEKVTDVNKMIDWVQSQDFLSEEINKQWFTTKIWAGDSAPFNKRGAYCIDAHTPNGGGFKLKNFMKISVVVDILPPNLADDDAFEDSPAGGIKLYTYDNGIKTKDIAINESSAKILLKLGYLGIQSYQKNEEGTNLYSSPVKSPYKIAMANLFGVGKQNLINAGFPKEFMNQYKSQKILDETKAQMNEANKAVSKLYSISLSNKTDPSKVTATESNGKTYIGPYKIKFSSCEISHAKYDGKELKKYSNKVGGELFSFGDLTSGETFYIVVDGTITDINKKPKIYTKEVEVYRARMLFADGGGDTQNFVYYKGKTYNKPLDVVLPPPNYIKDTQLNIFKLENSEIDESKYKIESILDTTGGGYLNSQNLKAGFVKDSRGKYVEIEEVVDEDKINALNKVTFIIAHRVKKDRCLEN